jgi:hypothetical protein
MSLKNKKNITIILNQYYTDPKQSLEQYQQFL